MKQGQCVWFRIFGIQVPRAVGQTSLSTKALTPRSCPPQQSSSPPFWPYVNQDYPTMRGLLPAPPNCKRLSGFSCSKPLSPSRDQVPSPWTTSLPSSLALILPEPRLFSSPRCTKCQVRSTLSSPGKQKLSAPFKKSF